MSKLTRNVGYSLCFLMMFSLFLIPNASFAKAENSFYADGFKTKEDLIHYFQDNHVSNNEQKLLINKVENNQLWDVNNPEKLKEVPEDFYIFDPKNGSEKRYYRFEDGSFIKIETTQNNSKEINSSEESLALRGVESGTGYSHYYDYKVELTKGGMYASMVTEFVLVNGGNDYLIPSGFFEPRATGFGELGQMPSIQIVRENEDSSLSRWALANSNWYVNYPISTPWGGSSLSGTKYLWIGVGNNSFKVSDSTPY
ncbi:hypothetical protein ABE142_10230 [Paenibacillus alvei]|uniref:hypothetical protein n=2 Tax=Paenibacillus alvei TaxID=44250 RepID=UPI003D2E39CA